MNAASLKARLGSLRRRLLGTGTAPEVQARLDHHDRALHDITAALQQVQAVVPPPGTDRAEALVELQRRVDALEHHLPELLGLWSSATGTQRRLQRQLDQRATASEQHATSIDELWQRIEFVRREVLYEMRYGDAGSDTSAGDEAPDVRVVDAERVERITAQGGLRLNLGCGHLPMDDYVNVDMRELPGVDVVAPIDQLPFDEGAVAEIHSAHVLEHFPQEDLQRRLLPYWRDRLAPGGVFRATVPDGVAMLDGHARGEIPFEDLRAVLYGGQEYEGDFHFTMFGADTLTALLEEAGFTDVRVEAQGRPNDICLELQVAARRPE
ncbi:MAG: class I SAM-dependent methyltransferase [Microthrixaceae bacterium]